jgi:cytochrome c553
MVSATKHNLADNPNIQFGFSSSLKGGSEVCVYCHTAHGAGFAGELPNGFPPLWNRKINSGTIYQTYAGAQSAHFESSSVTTLNSGGIKGVSLACLSCHDGTIAFDALINLQGSGGYVPNNATLGDGTTPGDTALSASLFGPFNGNAVDANRSFKEGTRGNTVSANGPFGGSVFSNDTLDATNGASPFPNLTTDLKDDHPISFRIPDGTADPQFAEMINGAIADGNQKMLYLKRTSSGGTELGIYPQDKRDRIRAYASAGGLVTDASNANAYIECASCHNPHTPRTLFLRLPSDVDSNGNFGTIGVGLPSGGGLGAGALQAPVTNATYWSHAPNQASAICISCHQK